MSRVADRMGRIAPFYVMDLLARARKLESEGRTIVHMEIGEPDFDTPARYVTGSPELILIPALALLHRNG